MTIIERKALSEARSMVKSMLWQMHPPDELKFVWAKGCAVVASRKMMKEYKQTGVYSKRYEVLKALPKAINSLKYKK